MRPNPIPNLDNPMNSIGGRKSPMGLGTLAEKIIHAGLNVTPMPAKVRAAIKGCAGCRKRKNAMNRLIPNIFG